ncbi:prepilin-type N-terminal cleavage/methylation domain-containing protein [Oxalobacteraceae bacterium R-40]|uniref:Prepilin-type N-terminal cleavage/methylation domain-containing protein n=1 Tax=Keguizhuia sedimenti TaxID=3064264 RepID=A0ABU1BQC7_9BURK|nr:prepilin-type N-terminal cleavage/methylation domain-containing protein [Oxalobacteraceae bacterium R-40]
MFTNHSATLKPSQSGVTLIELVMFIVIVSVGIVGILAVMDKTTRHSTDPMVRKQAIAVAEALLEEIQQQAFTFCDPDDANAATAANAAGCATTPQGLAPTAGESRGNNTAPFDNVGDYNGFSMTGISDIGGNAITELSAYNANVTVSDGGLAGVAANDSLRIDVRVFNPGQGVDITLTGYRLRYAPNTTP